MKIQKIYNVDPLKCPKCGGQMKIKGFIEDEATIKKVLKKLNLWNVKNIDPPCKNVTYSRKNKELYNLEYENINNGEDSYGECNIEDTFDADIDSNCDIYADEDFYDERLEIDLYEISEAIDILPNYEDEIDLLPNYDECFQWIFELR